MTAYPFTHTFDFYRNTCRSLSSVRRLQLFIVTVPVTCDYRATCSSGVRSSKAAHVHKHEYSCSCRCVDSGTENKDLVTRKDNRHQVNSLGRCVIIYAEPSNTVHVCSVLAYLWRENSSLTIQSVPSIEGEDDYQRFCKYWQSGDLCNRSHFGVLAGLAVLFCFLTRHSIKAKLGSDDWWTLAALILFWTEDILQLYGKQNDWPWDDRSRLISA